MLVGVAALLFILANATKPPAEVEVTGRPSLKVDQEQVDLGDVHLGRTVRASFVLTNVGDQPLRLTRSPYTEVVEGC